MLNDFWAPAESNLAQWYQYDFTQPRVVLAVSTVAPDLAASEGGPGFVRHYYVQYKLNDADEWSYVRNEATAE